DQPPAEPLRDQVGGDLAAVQGAGGEVPERPLAPGRLVHRQPLQPLVGDLGEPGGVRGPGDAPQQLELAGGQEGPGALLGDHRTLVRAGVGGAGAHVALGRWPFWAGQMWPVGSSGLPHSGDSGRPLATTWEPWRASTRSWGRVTDSRTWRGSGGTGGSVSSSSPAWSSVATITTRSRSPS